MEYGLRDLLIARLSISSKVLILVLMEYALREERSTRPIFTETEQS